MELAILSDEISLDLEEAFRIGTDLGFRKYEIRCMDDYEHRVPNFNPRRYEQILQLVEAGTIEVTAVTPGTFKIDLSDTDALRKEMDEVLPKACEMAKEMKSPTLITFGFMREADVNSEAIVSALKEAGHIAGEYNLKLAVENEPGSYCDTGENTAAIVKAIDQDHVGINWDPANAVVCGEAGFPIGYDAVLPYLQNVHIKDAIPIPPDKWENRLIGDGGVNWLGQLKHLFKDRPVEHLTLETHVFPLIESTKEDLRRLKLLFEHAQKLTNDSD